MRKFNILGMATVGAIVASAMFGTVGAKAQPKALPQFNLCTGSPDGTYNWAGGQVGAQARGTVNLTLVQTGGSLENLAKVDDGTCQGAFVQSDAFSVYKAKNPNSTLNIEVGTPLYKEVAHLVCNRDAKLAKITGLTKDMTVLVGAPGGGSSVTWDSFILADKLRYGVVPTLPIGGIRAVNRVKLGGADATCMLSVAALKTPSIMEANSIALTANGALTLVNTADSDLLSLKSPGKNGKPIYQAATIPTGTYPGGLQTGGLFSNAVDTVSVDALFVVNSAWIDANSATYDAVLRSVTKALPTILNRVGQQ